MLFTWSILPLRASTFSYEPLWWLMTSFLIDLDLLIFYWCRVFWPTGVNLLIISLLSTKSSLLYAILSLALLVRYDEPSLLLIGKGRLLFLRDGFLSWISVIFLSFSMSCWLSRFSSRIVFLVLITTWCLASSTYFILAYSYSQYSFICC